MGILTVVLWYGGHLVIQGKIESGLPRLVSYCINSNWERISGSLVRCGMVSCKLSVLHEKSSSSLIENRESRITANTLQRKLVGRIEFRNVKFSYPIRPDLPIMEDLTFTVEPGQVVALVGPSGGGKSSCIAMLEHFYEPNGGEVYLDGIPIREYDHKYLHTKVALVGQEPVLYARSVTENIGYGLDSYSNDDVQTSAKLANAHSFIMDTSDGYNTNVGEKGSQMSGEKVEFAKSVPMT
ncbi:hypothetical protein COOONC_17973 [Cooperia oncophora]